MGISRKAGRWTAEIFGALPSSIVGRIFYPFRVIIGLPIMLAIFIGVAVTGLAAYLAWWLIMFINSSSTGTDERLDPP